ncbi:hypothetical protein [Bacillus sp. FJAT-27251]|uniref:hypothetical protein n=1 Tax=Bacillus sp. FJAT-27251 TaxID=1684142 RepID=UPI0006A7B755|nr:hypothetical protein [Bacillus sp. FJAT-27251]
MKSHPIKNITASEMNKLLGLKHSEIADRELILKNSDTKKIEKVTLKTEKGAKAFFVKYGTTPSFIKEILFYATLSQPVRDQITKLFSYQFNPARYIMIFEWIDGENPDFTNKNVVAKVFSDLGVFAASFEDPVRKYQHGDTGALLTGNRDFVEDNVDDLVNNLFVRKENDQIFLELSKIAKRKEELIKNIGGEKLVAFLRNCENGLIDSIIDTIYDMPLVIHPGDVSKFNLLTREANNQTVVLDYENIKIAPMCMLMEYIGEKDIHVPLESLSTLALESYLNGWNSKSGNKIDWRSFYNSYICSRIMYKFYLLGWWLRKEGTKRDPGKEWILNHVNDLSILIDQVDTIK